MKNLLLSILATFVFACTAVAQHELPKNPFGHALVPDMIADASIEYVDGIFYCFATTDGYGRGLETSGPPVVWTSKDFVNWEFNGSYFPSADGQKYWAPSKAVAANGRWYIYPTVNGYMHVGVADKIDGPYRLARGDDRFTLPFTNASTLRQGDDRGGIDTEIFIDDDGKAYAFWGGRHVGRLAPDMMTLDSVRTLETRRKEYSEGPIFFKRKGIYYYLYTIGGDENYEYYYMMSRTSPFGPYEVPKQDRISTTDIDHGVFGPGHGCVFNVGDDYFFAFLEFGRNSTNRQTYVNRMHFNEDGTIQPVQVTLDGVGALRSTPRRLELNVKNATASSSAASRLIRYFNDSRCQRTEYFVPGFAFDHANGSRWMAEEGDSTCWLMADLGTPTYIDRSELCFVRPTAGHAYVLEGSNDGKKWTKCGGHSDVQRRSPHTDIVGKTFRYLRVRITSGVRGVWEWHLYQPEWGAWNQWGAQADGTFRNPVIPADYSDLDCIRVGNDYYAISSTMQFSPGMTILHSHDLVNWEIAGNAVPDLTQISPELNWDRMNRYGRGIWAGTLRHHNGRFYLFFGAPEEGFFMTSAPKAEGPWEPLTTLLAESGWDDCTALWDKDGKAYFLGTQFSAGYKTYLFDMSPDARSIDRKSARLVNEGNGREASKLLYYNGYYYIIFSEHRGGIGRYVMAKRDRSIAGDFKEEQQLLQACTEAHEPNQGGVIEGRGGRWYFLTHHGDGDWSGRIVSLLPVEWRDGWPMMGTRLEGEEIGRMTWSLPMPAKNKSLPMQGSDDFDGATLGPQWQWNYQPRADKFSLTERPGWMRLKAFRPIENDRLRMAGNTLTQRSFRTTHNEVTICMDISQMADGQKAGLCHFADHSGALGVVRKAGKTYLETRHNDQTEQKAEITTDRLWLRSTWGLDGQSTFAYSTDGTHFTSMNRYPLSWGFYRGDRIGIYCYNNEADAGLVDIDFFHYDCK